MANPLDREIARMLRKGQTPDAWKRPGAQKGGNQPQPASGGQTEPTGQPGTPPERQGMNKPGRTTEGREGASRVDA